MYIVFEVRLGDTKNEKKCNFFEKTFSSDPITPGSFTQILLSGNHFRKELNRNQPKWMEIYESDMGVSTNLEIRPKADEQLSADLHKI